MLYFLAPANWVKMAWPIPGDKERDSQTFTDSLNRDSVCQQIANVDI